MNSKFRMRLTLVALLLASFTGALSLGQPARANTTFPQTGQAIWGPFETYWQEHGGLGQFGMPRTSVYPTGKGYDAQWFERALFTYNPAKPDPYKVELQLLGDIITESRHSEAPFKPASSAPNALYFEATHHNISGKLLEYWQRTGGIAIYGYPISEAFMEQSKSDGKQYLVQYFERNRLEHHPELASTDFEVQLGLLGSELLDAQGGPPAFANLGAPTFYPANTGGTPVATPTTNTGGVPSAPSLPPTSQPVLFQSDFSTPDLSAWQEQLSLVSPGPSPAHWRVRNGMVEQYSDFSEDDTDEYGYLVTADRSFTDFTLEAEFYDSGSEDIGVVGRYGDGGYYLLKLYHKVNNPSPKAELWRITPAKMDLIASSTTWPGFTRNAWQRITFIAKGQSLSTQVEGMSVLQATDSTFSKGGVGLYTYAEGRSKFDNVRVTAP